MKIKLLKRFRKETPLFYSSEKEVTDSETKENIEGRFVVKHPRKLISYYCTTKESVLIRRREIILDLLLDYRVKNNWILKKIKI